MCATQAPCADGVAQSALIEDALRQAPGRPVVLLRPAAVKVRSLLGNALAYTVTHVLVEWDADGAHHARWEASWLVRRVATNPDEVAAVYRQTSSTMSERAAALPAVR